MQTWFIARAFLSFLHSAHGDEINQEWSQSNCWGNKFKMSEVLGEFPGGPVLKTPCFHFRGRGFNLWSGN